VCGLIVLNLLMKSAQTVAVMYSIIFAVAHISARYECYSVREISFQHWLVGKYGNSNFGSTQDSTI